MAPKLIDKIVYQLYLLSNPEEAELNDFINRDEGSNLKLSQNNIKSLQNELESNKLLDNKSKDNEIGAIGERIKKLKEEIKVLH